MRRRRAVLPALGTLLLGVGCNAVFGIQEGLREGDASVADTGRSPSSGPGPDGAAGDDANAGPSAQDAGWPDATLSDDAADAGAAETSVVSGCPSGFACDGGCVVANDIHNCGACGKDCAKFPGVASTGLSCNGGKCSYSCASAYADCFDAGTGCETPLANLCAGACGDVHNCGACGHDCAGGGCTAGLCDPVTLATNGLPNILSYTVPALAVGSLGIFWGDDYTTVFGMPLAGGTPKAYASAQNYPGAITLDSTTIYWANLGNPGEVMKETVTAGPTTPVTLASSQYTPSGIAVDATWVYWTGDVGGGVVNKIKIDGSSGGMPVTVESAQNYPQALALMGSNVYWTTMSNPATVLTASINGGPITTLATPGGNGSFKALAVGPTGVFWSDQYGSSVQSTSLTGGQVTTITSTLGPANSMVADGTYLYFTGSGNVWRVPVGGGTPLAIAKSLGGPLALYGSFLYWLNVTGAVQRLPL